MPRKRHTAEQIIGMLREAEAAIGGAGHLSDGLLKVGGSIRDALR